jgi:hypothetical protein
MQYKKIINRNKLTKFWSYFGKNVNNVFKLNFWILQKFYNDNYFIDINLLVLGIKKILPLFLNSAPLNKNIFYLLSSSFYSQTLYQKTYTSVKKIISPHLGIFTNFSATLAPKKFDLKKSGSFLVVFYLKSNDFLLLESKKKFIPTIALVNGRTNPRLIDYPIYVNNVFFYNIYFLNKILLRLILIN